MDDTALANAIREICTKDSRYRPEAYYFVLESLDFTARMLDKATKEGVERHVGGKELLDGIRLFALQEFGPMTLTVLNTWGLTVTRDFGEIVFNLVTSGKLRKTEQDRPEDFDGGYDFYKAFAEPFLPRSHGRHHGAAGAGRAHKHGSGADGQGEPPAAAHNA